jgi:hypothetical protein
MGECFYYLFFPSVRSLALQPLVILPLTRVFFCPSAFASHIMLPFLRAVCDRNILWTRSVGGGGVDV